MEGTATAAILDRPPHGVVRVFLVDFFVASLWILWGAMLCITIVGIYFGVRSIRRGFRILHQGNKDILSHGGKNRLARTTPMGRALGYKDVEDEDSIPS